VAKFRKETRDRWLNDYNWLWDKSGDDSIPASKAKKKAVKPAPKKKPKKDTE